MIWADRAGAQIVSHAPGADPSPIDGTTSLTTTWTYDARGNVLTETTPIDATTSVTAVNSYSATNDLLTRSEADNDSAVKLVTRYVYVAGDLESVNVNCTTTGLAPPTDGLTDLHRSRHPGREDEPDHEVHLEPYWV